MELRLRSAALVPTYKTYHVRVSDRSQLMQPFDIAPLAGGREYLVVLMSRNLKSVRVHIRGCYFEELYTICSGIVLSTAEAAVYIAAMERGASSTTASGCDPYRVLVHIIQPPVCDGRWSRPGRVRFKYRNTYPESAPDPPSYGPCDSTSRNSSDDGYDDDDLQLHNYKTHLTVKLIYRIPVEGGTVATDDDAASTCLPPTQTSVTSIVNVPQWLWHWRPQNWE